MLTILITGGTGFLGRALTNKLKKDYKIILCGRNNERNEKVRLSLGCQVVPMDVSNIDSVREYLAAYKPDIIIHAAATKYVHLAELYPNECLDINIKGAQNIVRASLENNVQTVIGISTDKASSSKSFYGLSKNVMERLFVLSDKPNSTRFMCVRFGNLPWSTGSVFHLWKDMLEKKSLIETTGLGMRRFFFKLDDAVNMVCIAKDNIHLLGGSILCPTMKSAPMNKILNLFIEKFGGKYVAINPRPGESWDETIISIDESFVTQKIYIDNCQYYRIDFTSSKFSDAIGPINTSNQEEMTREEIIDLIKFDNRSQI